MLGKSLGVDVTAATDSHNIYKRAGKAAATVIVPTVITKFSEILVKFPRVSLSMVQFFCCRSRCPVACCCDLNRRCRQVFVRESSSSARSAYEGPSFVVVAAAVSGDGIPSID